MSNTETAAEKTYTDLVFAIAMAEDAAQNADDRGKSARASQIRAQIRTMEAELATLTAAAR